MSLRTSARTPVRGRGRVVRRGARGGTSGWAIGSRVVPATAVPEELVNQVSYLLVCVFLLLEQYILIQNFVHGYCNAVWSSFFFCPDSGMTG